MSIEPQRYFLEQIAGDNFIINSIIPSGSNPETYDPTPSQMIALSKSIIYFKVGQLTFETAWINNLQSNNPGLTVIDCSVGIDLIEDNCGHDHAHEYSQGHDGADPHIWSSPAAASFMAKNMYEAILKIDPDNADYYKANYEKLLDSFAETDVIIREFISKAPSKSFLIYHPALSYYSHEYGLTQYTIEYEGKSPSPAHLKALIEKAKENDVRVVFIQKEFDEKNAETIAKEIGAKIVSLDLLSYNWEEELIKIAKSIALENE